MSKIVSIRYDSQVMIINTKRLLDVRNYIPAFNPAHARPRVTRPLSSYDRIVNSGLHPLYLLQLPQLEKSVPLSPPLVTVLIKYPKQTLENVIFEITKGRIPQEEITDRLMPLCAFLGVLEDEHPRLERLNEHVGDEWVTHMLEEVETALIGMGQDCRKLLLPEEANGGGEGSVEDEDARGERHFELALQQLGTFGFDCIYGA
ncbi:hypothetical protein P167DRAFT_547218 [Morchella conica CCBAS932]|uniref:Uncharacterized protein n=1 Tax=Morchella conica CCBAS932 TaxID=1392247 RepID=A0A3N4KIK0_9PEZI|nr:hypothetical protein P167DRAFT_547218 [Morchella conica CCBAS932]